MQRQMHHDYNRFLSRKKFYIYLERNWYFISSCYASHL